MQEKRESPLENRSNKLGKQKIELNTKYMAKREEGGGGGRTAPKYKQYQHPCSLLFITKYTSSPISPQYLNLNLFQLKKPNVTEV